MNTQLLNAGDVHAATKATVAHAREASDHIRSQAMAEMLHSGLSSKNAYFHLHRLEVNKKPVTAAAFIPGANMHHLRHVLDNIDKVKRVGVPRINQAVGYTGSIAISHANPLHLPQLLNKFFAVIDELSFASESDALHALSVVYALCDSLHLSEDVSGRTNEDFTVWLSKKWGYPISISDNGYRGVLMDDWHKDVAKAQMAFFRELLFKFATCRSQTALASPDDVRLSRNLDETLFDLNIPRMFDINHRFGKHHATVLENIIALLEQEQWEEIMERFPSINKYYKVIADARKREYFAVNGSSDETDTMVVDVLCRLQDVFSSPSKNAQDLSDLADYLANRIAGVTEDDPVTANICTVVRSRISNIRPTLV